MKVEQLCWVNFLASVVTSAIQDRLVQDWLEQNLRQWCTGHTWKQFHGTATFVEKWENHFVAGREMQYPMKRRGFWMMVYHAIGWNHLREKCWGYFFGLLWSDRGENQLKWYKWEGLKLTTKTPTLNPDWRGAKWREFSSRTVFPKRSKDLEIPSHIWSLKLLQLFQRLFESFWYLWFEEVIISNDLLLVVE